MKHEAQTFGRSSKLRVGRMHCLWPVALCAVAWSLGVAWRLPAAAPSTLTDTRLALEKWVETRQLISKTKTDWQTDKETIEQTILLFERERMAVEEEMSKLNTNSVQVDKERLEAEALLKTSNESLEQAREFAASFEPQLAKLLPRLPESLRGTEEFKKLVDKLPADPAKTDMGGTDRIQLIVSILNEFDKFNNAVTIFTEKRRNGKGEEVSVETIYVGLGAAYFVNEAGDFAGTGTPGADGWEWSVQPEVADAVREVIRIYRNERTARFVPLPAVVR